MASDFLLPSFEIICYLNVFVFGFLNVIQKENEDKTDLLCKPVYNCNLMKCQKSIRVPFSDSLSFAVSLKIVLITKRYNGSLVLKLITCPFLDL